MLSITTKSSIPRLSPIVICVGLALMQGTSSYAGEGADLAANSDGETKEAARKREDGAAVMKSVVVIGERESPDEKGKGDVFNRDIVNVYQAKEEIENYKGTSVGDLLKGMSGVYTGEARNSGALDPNIRGLQGTGRIPVLIDGTEQSTTVWLGPAGVSNRSYVDPNLVGGITAEKGPSFEAPSGLGGALRIRTLEPGDIIKPGESFGIELRTEAFTNSIKKPKGGADWLGQDFRSIPGLAATGSDGDLDTPAGTGWKVEPRRGGSDFNGDDYSWRLALATEQEHYSLLAAHSYRLSGNYFSGSRGASDYMRKNWEGGLAISDQAGGDRTSYRNYLAQVFKPGDEVLNTHSELTSTLLKGTLELPDSQTLSLNWMKSKQVYGETIPHVIINQTRDPVGWGWNQGGFNYHTNNLDSKNDQETWKLGYAWNPDSPLIDFQANLWMSRSEALRHQNGGSMFVSTDLDNMYSRKVICHEWPTLWPDKYEQMEWMCKNNPQYQVPADYQADSSIDGTIVDKSWQTTKHDRYGFDVSNRFKFGSRLNLTVSGGIQHEDLDEQDALDKGTSSNTLVYGNDFMGTRSGQRREYNAGLYMEWFPTERLMVSGGLRWSRYWSYDEKLAENRQDQLALWERRNAVTHTAISYGMYLDQAQVEKLNQYTARRTEIDNANRAGSLTDEQKSFVQEANAWLEGISSGYLNRSDAEKSANANQIFYGLPVGTKTIGEAIYLDGGTSNIRSGGPLAVLVPTPSSDHRGFEDNNPFYNGTFDVNETVTVNGKDLPKYLIQAKRYDKETGEDILTRNYDYRVHTNVIGISSYAVDAVKSVNYSQDQWWPKPQKRRNEAWAPMLGLTYFLTDYSRAYVRYSEFVRFPSPFEDFQSAKSLIYNREDYRLSPERTRNIEVGFVQSLTPWLRGLDMAEIRLNYYNNRVANFIDRNTRFDIVQFDEKRTEGLELQAIFDSGRYFGGLAATYRLNNELCDKDYAAKLDPYNLGEYPKCVTAGFPKTFTRASLQPDYSVNIDGGVRLFNSNLEIGFRGTYHSSAENEDEKKWIAARNPHVIVFSEPNNWNPILVWDAYFNYNINDALMVSGGVNNITDEYYLDPLARTTLPAPGRTFRLSLTASF